MTTNSIGLARYLQTLRELLNGAFCDLLFAGHKTEKPLVIRCSGIACKFVRLRLPAPGCLHLESVLVFSNERSWHENIAVNSRLTSSSVYPGGESLLEARMLVDPGNNAIGMHTDFGPGEWVCLELDRDSDQEITEVVVYNRDDRWQSRAWGLVVETSVDGLQWTELYNHATRQNLLIECLREATPHIGGTELDLKAAIECTEIVRLLFKNDHDDCQRKLDQMLWAGAYGAATIRGQLSDAILSKCELDWNSHGIVRPFRYWAIEEKTEYLKQVRELIDDLAGLSSHVCLGFGFVLAYLRDGDLIAHDDDIDVLVAFDRLDCPSISSGLRMLESHLVPLGYAVTGDHFSHRWITKSTWNPALPHIDVFIGLKEDAAVSWYPGDRGNLRFDEVFPPEPADLFGVCCPIPKHPIRYLDRIYGPNWRVPDTKFGHPWNKAEFEDIA